QDPAPALPRRARPIRFHGRASMPHVTQCSAMRLSFVIPTRNQARFIGQCIDGCFAQAIPDSEIIVVDGASTDHTRDVLAGYGERIRWISERDRGQSDAVNKGVRMA